MILLRSFLCSLCLLVAARAEVPRLLHHQGRMAVQGVPFEGTGQFKFALVDGSGGTSYWSNDGSSVAGSEPADVVSLPVSRGLYSVLMGENMAALPDGIFTNPDVRLRVWFNDGNHGFQLITPDQRLVAAPYALVAAKVDQLLLSEIEAPPVHPVVAWGGNSRGQTTVPPVLSGSNTAAISARGDASLALLKDGTVVRWGGGPAVPAGLSGVKSIAAGVDHGLALKTDGSVAAWGDNSYGQGVTASIHDATAIAAGEKHSVILHQGGSVSVVGDNTFDQTTVPPLGVVTAIAAGYDHSLALDSNGKVTAWGRNDAGQSTVPPSALDDVVAIAAGAFHSLAVKSDGSVVAWGLDAAGQSTVPFGLGGVRSVAAGYSFSVALKEDGSLLLWGDGSGGLSSIPAEAVQLTAIAAGDSHVLALHADLMPAQVARLDQQNTFTGKMGIRRAAVANALEVEGNASKSIAGAWLSNSDRRIKTDIRQLTGAVDKIDSVRLVDFRYTDQYLAAHPGIEDRRYLNVIAQEFAKVFPDHVKSSGERMADGSEILQVDTYPLTIYSAAAVQELHRENQELRSRLAEQEQRLRRLEENLER